MLLRLHSLKTCQFIIAIKLYIIASRRSASRGRSSILLSAMGAKSKVWLIEVFAMNAGIWVRLLSLRSTAAAKFIWYWVIVIASGTLNLLCGLCCRLRELCSRSGGRFTAPFAESISHVVLHGTHRMCACHEIRVLIHLLNFWRYFRGVKFRRSFFGVHL